jgi:hypothetical protein
MDMQRFADIMYALIQFADENGIFRTTSHRKQLKSEPASHEHDPITRAARVTTEMR